MSFLMRSNNKAIILLLCFIPLFASAQEKNILERKLSVKLSGEVMDPTYAFFEVLKLPTRLYIGAEYKLNKKYGIGANIMYANYKTYPWDALSGGAYEYIGDSMTMINVGRTVRTGGELIVKRFRSKKSAFYPIGSYFEFGLGLHNSKFTGYDLDYYESYYQNGSYVSTKTEIREEERNIKTVSLIFRTGKQWVFDNNLFWGYGFSFRGHLPISSLSDDVEDYTTADLNELYTQEILLTDWFTTHLCFGYIL